jgi:pyruvate dehydrogenase E1 component alpha subunit
MWERLTYTSPHYSPKQNLPILFLVIDNGRAINTFTPDVAANSDVWLAGQVGAQTQPDGRCMSMYYLFLCGTPLPNPSSPNPDPIALQHYGIPGVKVDGQNAADTLKTGRAVVDYVRKKGPAILQVRIPACLASYITHMGI